MAGNPRLPEAETWIVAEAGPHAPAAAGHGRPGRYGEHINAVVLVGAAVWRGSPNSLDRLARLVLLPHMSDAVARRRPLGKEVFDRSSGQWVYQAIPLFAPGSDELVVGVAGCYHRPGQSPPEPPRIGTWLWELTDGGPDHTNRLCWDDGLFRLHGLDAPSAARADAVYPLGRWWHGPHFVQDLVLEGWQPRVREFRDTLAREGAQRLVMCSYRGVDQLSGQPLPLRMVGRATATPGRFQGMAFLDSQAHNLLPEGAWHDTDPGAVDRHQAANYVLHPHPVLMVDTWLEEISSMSPKVEQLRLKLPDDRHLRKLVHPLEWPAMRDLLNRACAEPNVAVGPQPFRLAVDASTPWRPVAITAVGVAGAQGVDARRVLLSAVPVS